MHDWGALVNPAEEHLHPVARGVAATHPPMATDDDDDALPPIEETDKNL